MTQAAMARRGHPKAAKGTVRLTGYGALRLSEDLLVANRFQVRVDGKKLKLYLTPSKNSGARLWKASERAASGFLSLAGPLRAGGVDFGSAETQGEYRAVVRRGVIEVDLHRRNGTLK